jgi:tetratricopeptide (TPR) repeat protein
MLRATTMRPGDVPEETLGSATTEVESHERPRHRSEDAPRDRPPAFAPGAVLADRYVVARFLARGGMGEVYEAEDRTLQMRVALKSIAPEEATDARMIERLKREVLLARKVTHPNVCRLYDLGFHVTEGGTVPFLTMDLLRGETLAAYIARRGKLTTSEALPLVRDMAAALQAAHEAGVIHRDFKSRNVIVEERTATGESGGVRAIVMDFGIAVAASEEERRANAAGEGRFVGTPAYMAPEQVKGSPTTRATDIYALGIVMYEMTTGTLPFAAATALESVGMRLTHDPTPPRRLVPAIGARWNDVILRCLARDPEARFPNAQAVFEALLPPAHKPTRGRLAAGGAIAAATLAILGVAEWTHLKKLAAEDAPVAAEVAQGGVSPGATKRRPTLAILELRNEAGGEGQWLSTAIADVLRADLQADEALRLVPGDRAVRAGREIGVADDATLPAPALQKLRQNLGVDYAVTGRYAAAGGDQVHVEVTLSDARSGKAVARLTADGSRARLWEIAAPLGASLRKKLGLRDPTAAESQAARAASPGTPEASKAYAEGQVKLAASDLRGAVASFTAAVAADPRFPLAYAGLAMAESSLGEDGAAVEHARKAFEMSGSLAREDQLAVEARYRGIAKEWDRALEIWRTLFAFAPDNLEYGLRYAQAFWAAGRPDEALPVIAALRALPAPEKDDPRIDYYESVAASKRSDFHLMVSAGRAAAEKAERIGALTVAARGHHQVAEGLTFLRDLDGAAPEWDKTQALYAQLGERQGQADALDGLAQLYMSGGDVGRALPLQERALAITREVGSRYKIANGVTSLAQLRDASGDSEGARVLYQEARGLYEAIRDREGIGNAIGNEATRRWEEGMLPEARALAAEAQSKLREVNERDGVTMLEIELAGMAIDAGELAQAATRVTAAEALAKEIGMDYYVHCCERLRAEIARDVGDAAEAKRLAGLARAGFAGMHAGSEVRDVDLFLAEIALDEGRPADAEALAAGVAALTHATSEKPIEATARAVLAESLAAQEKDASPALADAAALGSTRMVARLDLARARARSLASSPGGVPEALRELAAARETANKAGFVVRSLELRLAAALLARGGDARAKLDAVAHDANAIGAMRIARAAHAAARQTLSGEGASGASR